MQLRPYQEKGIVNVAKKLKEGKRRVLYQLATGGGKTVIMASISDRFTNKGGKCLILVHRIELLNQTIKTIFKWFNKYAYPVVAGKKVKQSDIYVGMVETVANKPESFNEIKLLIKDETHLGNFKKMDAHFPAAMIIGFTATPISSSKKDPLYNYYDDIVTGPQIKELIEWHKIHPLEGLVQNLTYAPDISINRNDIKLASNGEFDLNQMGSAFSTGRNVINAFEHYKNYCDRQKALFYNCNIEHSRIVCAYFQSQGYNARHIDGENGSPDGTMSKDEWRKDCFRWLEEEDDAILMNVGIATVGTDIPSVLCICVNKFTASLSHWLQMGGRGGRPYVGKDFFTILDLGKNVMTHGDWSDDRDWEHIFWNPPKPSKDGIAPVKECPNCSVFLHASSMKCHNCGFVFEEKAVKYDLAKTELRLYTQNIDVEVLEKKRIEFNYKPFYPLFQICNQMATQTKINLGTIDFSNEMFVNLLPIFDDKAKEWYNSKEQRYTADTKKFTNKIFRDILKKQFPEWPQQ